MQQPLQGEIGTQCSLCSQKIEEFVETLKKDKNVPVEGGKSKKKKKKNKKGDAAAAQDSSDKENVASENGGNLNDESAVLLNETMIANLQRQFEKVAEEAGLDDGVASACDSPQAVSASGRTLSKKRKRTKSLKGKVSQDSAELDGEESAVAKGGAE